MCASAKIAPSSGLSMTNIAATGISLGHLGCPATAVGATEACHGQLPLLPSATATTCHTGRHCQLTPAAATHSCPDRLALQGADPHGHLELPLATATLGC